jgi:hypothetical protein
MQGGTHKQRYIVVNQKTRIQTRCKPLNCCCCSQGPHQMERMFMHAVSGNLYAARHSSNSVGAGVPAHSSDYMQAGAGYLYQVARSLSLA